MADDFVHLHTHSDCSQLDGLGKIADYVKVAKERGNRAIGFTDHGTMRGYMQLYEETKGCDVHPIYGAEFYVSPVMRRRGLTDEERADITKDLKKSEHKRAIKEHEEREGIRDRWHLTVWAHNDVGLRNLYKLSSAAWIEGFYYKPRIDLPELIKYQEGLMVASGCLSSPINDCWYQGKRKFALDFSDQLSEVFGDRYWLEVQPHAIADQRIANELMLELRDRYGSKHKLLATQDAHYVHQDDAPHHEVLLCIGTGSNLSDPDRFKFDGDEFFLKTRRQLIESFKRHHEFIPSKMLKEALDSTVEFAERCNAKVEVDYHAARLPDPGIPAKYKGDDFAYLKDLCLEGWAWREIPRRAADYSAKHSVPVRIALQMYKDRLKHELRALKTQKFVPYFIIIYDLYKAARAKDIMCGPGRGSVAGSLVAYLIGVTSVDPIEHGLLFERFINPTRIDMPDCDMDFEDRRRGEVIEYIRQKYGEDRVCQIATIGKLSGKQCLRDVSRVLEVPLNDVNQVTNSIIERSSGDERASQTIEDSFREFAVCRDFNKRYPDVLKHAKKLEGMGKTLGIHAAGVVASPVPLTDLMPLEIRNHNGEKVVVSAIDMYGVAAAGLVKLDVLGLRTLTVLKECVEAIEARHGRKIDLESADVGLNDKDVLDGFTRHDYGGVFQYDTPSADKVCAGVKFTSFEDVAAMTALNRPGTSRSGLATKYVERKKNPELVKKVDFHPLVSEITKDTLGIIVYQEHVIKIFTQVAGFNPATADSLRKVIAKKIGDETLGKERKKFIEGAAERGVDAKTAGKIMDAITFFGCVPWWTQIDTPNGSHAIDTLAPGDEVYSMEAGERVVNRIKDVRATGVKPLYQIQAAGNKVVATSEHWWLCIDKEYRRTSELEPGMYIAYVTDLGPDAAEKDVFKKHLRDGDVLPWSVRSALSARIQTQANGGGQSGWKPTQQAGRSAGQGLETRQDQEAPERSSSSPSRQRSQESGVEGRPHIGLPHGQGIAVAQVRQMPEVRSEPGHGTSSAKLEGASRPSQGPGQEEQQPGQFGSHLPEVSQQGALEGKAGWWFRIESVEQVADGSEHIEGQFGRDLTCYDIEVEGEPHNYVADGFVCHNSYGFNKSHATSYGMIAYWGMWLKTYYPLEFYWALLKNEPDRIRIQQLAKDAKRHGIELLPPHVNVSNWHFSIDDENRAIRGSLVDIKGVGQAASKAIIETQPYKGLLDFVDRVDRRKCHRGVVVALASAGAMERLLPNTKHFVENIDRWWKALTAKKRKPEVLRELLSEAREVPDYTDEERILVATGINPLAFGKHPVDAYESMLKRHVKVPLIEMGGDNEETFFKDYDHKGFYLAGVIVEVKYNQVGDFHTGELPSESERRRQFWGRRYANVNIEDRTGKQNRFKFDFDIFDDFREIIDRGVGTPIIVHGHANEYTGTCRAHWAVDLGVLRKKLKMGAELDPWESIVVGHHAAKLYPWSNEALRESRLSSAKFRARKYGGYLCAVVTHVRLKYDRKGNLMGFFGLLTADHYYIEVICFRSVWVDAKHYIKAGKLVRLEIDAKPDKRFGWSYFYNGGKLRIYKKKSAAPVAAE